MKKLKTLPVVITKADKECKLVAMNKSDYLRYVTTHPQKMSLWMIIIDIGHTSKVPNYDTYLMLFTPFFSKKFVTDFEKIRHFYGTKNHKSADDRPSGKHLLS